MNSTIIKLLKFELLQTTRSLYAIMQPIMLFAFLIVLYPITMSVEQYQTVDHLSSICIFGIFFSLIYGAADLFYKDQRDGFLEQLYLSNISCSCIIISRILVNTVIYLVPMLLLVFFATIIYNIEHSIWMLSSTTLFFIQINMLVVFSLTLCIKNQRNNILKVLVIYPIAITFGILYNIVLNKVSNHASDIVSVISLQIGVTLIVIPIVLVLSNILLKDSIHRLT